MKKVIMLATIIAGSFSLSACNFGDANAETETPAQTIPEVETTKEITPETPEESVLESTE